MVSREIKLLKFNLELFFQIQKKKKYSIEIYPDKNSFRVEL